MADSMPSFDDEHEAFAASRSSQYVYVPARDQFYTTLDQHADTLEGDTKLPLVILGGEGSGKSALLANWVMKRRVNKHRDEFLFQHFVGCSSQSCQLSHTLFRLETALKDFFQLREMEVPDSEERLRWSLNRFLGAAAKKHSPARIVIIIDGVNRLKGEGAPDGALHWLPTELPPCVRFIISSVEFERGSTSKEDMPPHRTAIELARRQCPILRMEPLSVPTRQNVINQFASIYPGKLELQESQQFKLVTTGASAQPLYLRSLLQSIRLGLAMTDSSIDILLDTFLRCNSAFELIEKSLNLCSHAITGEQSELLGNLLTVVYVSRNGLSEDEIWGLIKMVSHTEPDIVLAPKLFSVLGEFSMVVNGLHSFSHEIYREVVYEKYICSSEALVRWNHLMARFFGQLPPCDRKLVCLPYHLEVAGSWSKVKNCLTEIDMFRLWWTPKFKKEFITLWASLTARPDSKKSMDDGDDTSTSSELKAKSRPVYDIVEEYVRSLDEYRDLKEPKDEEVSETILQIADFLIEFATLGHELKADVPPSIHPGIPSDDLGSLGVPYIAVDEAGYSMLVVPSFSEQEDGPKANVDAPTKPNDDLPECTTYFFHRWMWIQFPFIALGNCGDRYFKGIKAKQRIAESSSSKIKRPGDSIDLDRPVSVTSARGRLRTASAGRQALSKSLGAASVLSMSLPEIKFVKKAAKTLPRVATSGGTGETNFEDEVSRRMLGLEEMIRQLREEYDFLVGQKIVLAKRLDMLKVNSLELERQESTSNEFDDELNQLLKKEDDVLKKMSKAKVLNQNLSKLIIICERHPPENPALTAEVDHKLRQDEYLIEEIKKRIWAQRLEKQSYITGFRKMKQIVQQGVDMHTKLLEFRYDSKRRLQAQAAEDLRLSQQKSQKHNNAPLTIRDATKQGNVGFEMTLEDKSKQSRADNWTQVWSIISQRTGITDPDIFFHRLKNSGTLEDQMSGLKKSSEGRLNALKTEAMEMELEMEETRNEASFAGGQSGASQKQKDLAGMQQDLRRQKERTESSEHLQQRVVAGLNHICELLNIPLRGEDAAVVDILKDIDQVLDTILEDRDKSNNESTNRSRDTSSAPESHHRPELDSMMGKLELPKARLASKLPSRAVDTLPSERESEDDDLDDEGMWDRNFAKTQAQKNLRSEKKKAQRQNKLEAVGAM